MRSGLSRAGRELYCFCLDYFVLQFLPERVLQHDRHNGIAEVYAVGTTQIQQPFRDIC